jgi:hypothetical protein
MDLGSDGSAVAGSLFGEVALGGVPYRGVVGVGPISGLPVPLIGCGAAIAGDRGVAAPGLVGGLTASLLRLCGACKSPDRESWCVAGWCPLALCQGPGHPGLWCFSVGGFAAADSGAGFSLVSGHAVAWLCSAL